MKHTSTPYEDLANAIIIEAVKDYRKALNILSMNPYSSEAIQEKQTVERFFRSGWFGILTKLDPEVLISKLSKEVA